MKNYFRFKNGVRLFFFFLFVSVTAIRNKNTYDNWKLFVKLCAEQPPVLYDSMEFPMVLRKEKIEATVSGCGWPSSVSILVQCSLNCFFSLSEEKLLFFCCWIIFFPPIFLNWKFHFSHHWIWRNFFFRRWRSNSIWKKKYFPFWLVTTVSVFVSYFNLNGCCRCCLICLYAFSSALFFALDTTAIFERLK